MTSSIVVYYTRTGNTRVLARCIADVTGAELEELRPASYRRGLRGWISAVSEAVTGRLPRLLQPPEDIGHYDIVYIGGPIWMGRYAPAVRAYARRFLPEARRVAFFATQGGTDIDRAWTDLARLCGMQPAATLTVQAAHVRDAGLRGEIARFVLRARRTLQPARAGASHTDAAPAA